MEFLIRDHTEARDTCHTGGTDVASNGMDRVATILLCGPQDGPRRDGTVYQVASRHNVSTNVLAYRQGRAVVKGTSN